MTRAGEDNSGQVSFDDGLSAEYAVNNATLIIFDKDSKEFKQAFNLSSSGFTTDDTFNVGCCTIKNYLFVITI